MFRRSVWCLVYLGLLLITFGCDKSNDSYQKQIDTLQRANDYLQLVLSQSKQKVDRLQLELSDSTKKVDELKSRLISYSQPQAQLNSVIEEYPWLNKLRISSQTKWEKVIVSYGSPESMISIEDPYLLQSFSYLLHLESVGQVDYPNGYQTDIDTYVYELYENGEKYEIKVVDRGIIEIEEAQHQLFFRVDPDIHQLGAAFMPKPWFIKHDGLIAKMAASGALRYGDQYYSFQPFRMQLKVSTIHNETLLKNKPERIGDRVMNFTFYYYGTELLMDVYKEHVHIFGDGDDEWYYVENAEFYYTNEPG